MRQSSYKGLKDYKKLFLIIFCPMLIVTFIIAISIGTRLKKVEAGLTGKQVINDGSIEEDYNNEDMLSIKKITLENSKKSYYIDIANKISTGKMQIDWREIAAVNEVIGEGKQLDKEILRFGEEFYDEFTGELLSFDKVLNNQNLTKTQKKDIKEYLLGLGENFLYTDLNIEEEKIEFVNKIKYTAIDNYRLYRILPSITIGQAILESGWGESELSIKSNNIFGIKADNRWDGAVETVQTSENYNDIINANFRKYSSLEESVEDHGLFLYENKRYEDHGLFEGKNYINQAQSLEDAGYSTSKNQYGEAIYADKLISIIDKYSLNIFDAEAIRESK